MNKTITKNKKAKNTTVGVKPINIKNYYYLLGLIVFFVFANTISGGYNLDDELVTMNHRFTSQGLNAIKDIFTNSYYADDLGYAYGYRPMVHLSFAIEHQFFGESPKVSHFFNVLLYVLSVVLFFKLLLKWFGIEQLKLAFLTVILFALHPVHTEVVASIKNRDEILAFLFIVLSGLSMIKFLEKGKISSLIWLFALFSMAMLSKKSAYPMAIILPVAIVLFREVSRKQLALISLSVIIPAAWIGSELSIIRMILMVILPVVGIGFIYLVKTKWLEKGTSLDIKSLPLKPYIPAILIALITGWAFYTISFSVFLLIIPFIFWLIRTNFQLGLIAIVIISFVIGLEFGIREFKTFPLLITMGYFFYSYTPKDRTEKHLFSKISILWTFLLIIALVLFLLDLSILSSFLILINAVVIFLLIFKKPLWGMIYAISTSIGITLYFMDISFYALIILIFSVLFFFKDKLKFFNWSSYLVAILFSGLVLFFWSDNYQSMQTLTTTVKTELPVSIEKPIKPKVKNNFLKEGRELEFAENSLVAPHTTKETIGTGAATLGEYIRLMVFPSELSFYYGFARMDTVSLSNPFVWISILFHLGLIFMAIWQLKKRPIISFGIAWYLLSIILFSNWIELVAGMVAERLLFIASAGFCIFVAGVILWIKPTLLSKKPFVMEGIVTIVLLLFVVKTIHRNNLWKDPLTLMENDVKHLQNSAQANNLYALRLMEYSTNNLVLPQNEKDLMHQKAISHFDKAIRIDSTFFNALFDKGRAAQFVGDSKTTIETFKIAIEREPNFLDSYQYLLMEYEKLEDWPNYLKIAKDLVLKSDIPSNYDFISKGFFMQNQADSSLIYINQGLSKFPTDAALLDRKNYLESVVVTK